MYILNSVSLSVCLSICLFVCLSVCLFLYISVYLSACMFVSMSLSLSVCISIFIVLIHFSNVSLSSQFLLSISRSTNASLLGSPHCLCLLVIFLIHFPLLAFFVGRYLCSFISLPIMSLCSECFCPLMFRQGMKYWCDGKRVRETGRRREREGQTVSLCLYATVCASWYWKWLRAYLIDFPWLAA